MMKRIWIDSAALIVGGVGGPPALVAAKAAQPAIGWEAIPLAFFGAFLGTIFVVGIQMLRRRENPAQLVLRISEPLSALVLGAGVGALVTSAVAKEVEPASVFFLVLGVGLALGVVVSSLMVNAKFKHAL